MQFFRKTGIVLLLLSLLPFTVFAECDSIELHPSVMIAEGKANIVVLVSCGGMALADTGITISYPSGKAIEAKTGANGEVSIQSAEEGAFLFTVSGEGGNETKVVYKKALSFTMLRTADTYTICVDKPAGQIEIIDGGIAKILPLDSQNCAVYTSPSASFEVKASTETGKTATVLAGKILSIEAPDTIRAGEGFIAKALDNSQPAPDANISFMGEQKTSSAAGEAVFYAKQAGEFEITAEKTGLQKAVKKILVLNEFGKLSVEFPQKARPGEIIRVLVSARGIPVENAKVELGKISKATGKDGAAFFAVQEEGILDLRASAENFTAFSSAIEIKKAAIKALEIFAPEKIVAGPALEIQVKAGEEAVEAAKISVGNTEKTTDSRGFASFEGLGQGILEITASKEGFNGASKTIEITGPVGKPPENTFGILALLILLFGLLVVIFGVVRVIRKRRQFA